MREKECEVEANGRGGSLGSRGCWAADGVTDEMKESSRLRSSQGAPEAKVDTDQHTRQRKGENDHVRCHLLKLVVELGFRARIVR